MSSKIQVKKRLMLGIALYAWVFTGTSVAAPGWLAFGDLRGHIEPCGCDPATDLGGVRRLAAVVQRERAVHRDIGVFALGNDLPEPGKQDVKVPFLLEADAAMRPTAMLLNLLELRRLDAVAAFVKVRPKDAKALNLVLSNAKAKGAAARLASSVVDDGRFVVFGFTHAPDVEGLTEPMTSSLVAAWKSQLLKHTDRHRVLLFSGSDVDLQAAAESGLFDTIIASNKTPFSTEPGVEERKTEELLRRLVAPAVYAVPLGGQGLLRGGTLLFEEAKPLAAYLAPAPECTLNPKAAGCPAGGEGLPFRTAKRVTWLGRDVGDADGLGDLYARYDAAVKVAFKSEGEARLKDLAASPFAGVEACESCHSEAVKIYRGTKHAQAILTLQSKNKHQDGECIGCHTVGATQKGGFVSVEASPQLGNVQCESCHGPRKEHAKNPQIEGAKVASTKAHDVCVSCHNRQHSPAFEPVEYWQRIRH